MKGKRSKPEKGVFKSLKQKWRILNKVKKRQDDHFENAEKEIGAVDKWRELEKERLSREQSRENNVGRKQELEAEKVAVDMKADEKKEEIEEQVGERLGKEKERAKRALKAKVPHRETRGKRRIPKGAKKRAVRNYYDPWRSYPGMKKKPDKKKRGE
jgi:hypothetical protein